MRDKEEQQESNNNNNTPPKKNKPVVVGIDANRERLHAAGIYENDYTRELFESPRETELVEGWLNYLPQINARNPVGVVIDRLLSGDPPPRNGNGNGKVAGGIDFEEWKKQHE